MDVFVYGTLTDPKRVARVVSEFEFLGPAELDGMHRVDGRYPTLAPGGAVTGLLLRTPDVAALDAYEGVDAGLYVRASVPCERLGTAGVVTSDDDGLASSGGAASSGGEEPSIDAVAVGEADDRPGDVAVYVGHPEKLGVNVSWPGDGGLGDRVASYVRNQDVIVRPRDRE